MSRSKLHRHRRAIAAALHRGEPVAVIARRYGVGRDAAREYIARHLPALATDAELRRLAQRRERDRKRSRHQVAA